jgi:hypothetical protein
LYGVGDLIFPLETVNERLLLLNASSGFDYLTVYFVEVAR